MKTLLLVRHAKSSWSDPTTSDHDRPLNARGREAAPRAGSYLFEHGVVPDVILSSTAERAYTTATAIAEACEFPAEVTRVRELYHANPMTIAETVRALAGEADRAMVVAHNPGCEEFVERASGVYASITTANIAWFEWSIDDWSGLELDGTATLVTVWRPRDDE